eukprot:CAMPEP_0113317478 /NCGR_PEP_ID=MMETSP0010_2-20120614/12368_1 /TAXON_ID=216773 ORGANISM="Corethron hystrix, Strain 308" /NCGR_SAMPLE_ID=MMETSP0010_2 /ASSEMBLY_ACC=CAM_ASM_000155 /LENGTH=292 /DNA_ID=CAMNT_0000174463 /DNA_START=30 /DNA_END=908 /DNA_ORIENTATION=- /assembly_acc=CAM_ASM_000155
MSESFSDTFGSCREYESPEFIASGRAAEVYAARNISNGKTYAIKCIKFSPKKCQPDLIKNEINILKSINHPNVVALHDNYAGPQHHYLVMEYAENGDLMSDLQVQKRYTEKFARTVTLDLVKALNYCHQRGIVHRDLKPENILIDKLGRVKISDFGMAKRIEKSGRLNTYCGTLIYMAPEILSGAAYDSSIDVWSAGIIIFIMLSGYHPFHGKNDAECEKMIQSGRLYFHPPSWEDISSNAITLVKEMICPCPLQRSTAKEALKSSWLGDKKYSFKKKITSAYSNVLRKNWQ